MCAGSPLVQITSYMKATVLNNPSHMMTGTRLAAVGAFMGAFSQTNTSFSEWFMFDKLRPFSCLGSFVRYKAVYILDVSFSLFLDRACRHAYEQYMYPSLLFWTNCVRV